MKNVDENFEETTQIIPTATLAETMATIAFSDRPTVRYRDRGRDETGVPAAGTLPVPRCLHGAPWKECAECPK